MPPILVDAFGGSFFENLLKIEKLAGWETGQRERRRAVSKTFRFSSGKIIKKVCIFESHSSIWQFSVQKASALRTQFYS